MNRSIKKVIQVEGKRFSRPETAAKALAAGLANDLAGDGWHIKYADSVDEDIDQARFDREWDDYDAKCERIEARAYPRYLKVCKHLLK